MDPPSERQRQWRLAAQHGALGIEMVAAVVLGAVAGGALDRRFALAPWGQIGGFVLGLAAAGLGVYRAIVSQRRNG